MQKTHFRKAFAEVRAREEARGRRLNTDALIDLTVTTTQPPDFGVEYDTAVVMVGRLRRERPSVEGEKRPRRLFWLEMLRRVDD
ncbi:MAG: hypothetical protein K2H03_07185, partial [Muribaculaceae bacterium]|nr:hypothetical protein [Muribaculaceae bacterium]